MAARKKSLKKQLKKWWTHTVWPRARKLAFFGLAMFTLWFVWLLLSLPNVNGLDKIHTKPSIVVKGGDGQIIGTYGDVYGDYLPYNKIPKHLVNALLATEDRNFFMHIGVDPLGILRASVANVRKGRVVQGGSTITQQLAKNLFLTSDRTLGRKIREMLLAFKLEARFSKKEILAIYLNRMYLGAGTFGIDAASRRYFDKPATQMSLSESAVLVGLLKAPSRYSPTNNPESAKGRADQVLVNMVDAGKLNEKEADGARAALVESLAKTKAFAQSSYYYADWVVDTLPPLVGELKEDVEVLTTFDAAMQKAGEEAIKTTLDERGEKLRVSQAALVSMLPDGAVKALIGGRDYGESQFNRAVQAKRQPGSAFKLFVYLNALEHGMWPDATVVDEPVFVGNWAPQNYKEEYQGEMTLRSAVAQSINSVAVKMTEMYGRSNVVALAKSLGIESDLYPHPSIALGSTEVNLLELTTAYAHMASNGLKVRPYGVTKVITKKGKTLYERKPQERERVISEDVVGQMNTMLAAVVQWGTGTGANIGRPMAGKTGTTSDYKDAWFIGYTPEIATGVWVGNDTPKAMRKVTGGNLPASIWKTYMQVAVKDLPATPLPMNAGTPRANEVLPWSDREAESSPSHDTNDTSGDVELGSDFWNKLME